MEKLGAYEIVEHLEKGPLTIVLRAKHPLLPRTVVLRASIDAMPSRAAEAILREASFLEALDHPSVVRCLDVFEETGRPVIVLGEVRGVSLARLLEATPRLSIDATCAILRAVVDALAAVHAAGVVHADLKPKNVMLSELGAVVLIDFGHAVGIVGGPRDATRGGTAAYMAPEQLVGDAVPESDIFAVGALAYEMLSGRRAFEAGTQRGRGEEGFPPLRKSRPEVPPWLEELVHRCLARLASERPSPHAVLTAIDRHSSVKDGTRIVREALVAARLVEASAERAKSLVPPPNRAAFIRPIAALALLFVLSSVVAFSLRRSQHGADAPPGFVKVLATPWAEVTVDGRPYDTTPFARPIALVPGRHYLLFRHPSAKVERREIEIRSGETDQLDVTMNVGAARPEGER